MSAVASSQRRWLVAGIVALPLSMALLGFVVMPQLYSLYCRVTGTQMAPNSAVTALAAPQPTGRFVDVFFEARVFDGLPVELTPQLRKVACEVGVEAVNSYRIRNTSDRVVHTRPIHQVSPNAASQVFGMRLCFCFNDLVLQPGEERVVPLAFTFDPKLDPRIGTVSVCYSLFNIEPGAPKSADQIRIQREIESQGGVVSPGFQVMTAAEIEALRQAEQRQKGTP